MISIVATIQCDYEDCKKSKQITAYYSGSHSKEWSFEDVAGWDVCPYGGETKCPGHNKPRNKF